MTRIVEPAAPGEPYRVRGCFVVALLAVVAVAFLYGSFHLGRWYERQKFEGLAERARWTIARSEVALWQAERQLARLDSVVLAESSCRQPPDTEWKGVNRGTR